jgi:flagellar protein FliS
MDARSSYREGAVLGASPAQLVILLYEQAIQDLRRALIALEKGDIEQRTREINHAIVIIGQLQATLDMERGGEVAKNLERFYDLLRGSMVAAQVNQSARILRQQISDLVLLHGAWLEVERAATSLESASRLAPPRASADADTPEPLSFECNA